jgi:hypothetical protein
VTKRIVASAVGPDLRWATAGVTKTPRRKSSSAKADPTDEPEDF